MAGPDRDDRVVALKGRRDRTPLREDGAADQPSGAVAYGPNNLRRAVEPEVEHRCGLGRLVLPPDSADPVRVVGARRLDAVEVNGRREHRLADDGIVDQEQQVGGRSAELVAGDAACRLLQVMPCGRPVRAEPLGVDGAQPRDDRVLNRLVQDEALSRRLDECQPAEGVERGVGVDVRPEHGRENATRHPPRHGRRVEDRTCRLVEPVAEGSGERVDHIGGGGVRAVGHGAAGEPGLQRQPQRQRVPAAHPRDLGRSGFVVQPRRPHDRRHAFVVERSEREHFDAAELPRSIDHSSIGCSRPATTTRTDGPSCGRSLCRSHGSDSRKRS